MQINYFKVNNFLAFITLVRMCGHHLYLVPGIFVSLKETCVPSSPLPAAHGTDLPLSPSAFAGSRRFV